MSLKNIKEQLQLLQQAHAAPGQPKPKLVFNPASETMSLVTTTLPASSLAISFTPLQKIEEAPIQNSQNSNNISLSAAVVLPQVPVSVKELEKSNSQEHKLPTVGLPNPSAMKQTEELIRVQQAKIEELQQSLQLSQAHLLLQQQQMQDRGQQQLIQTLHNPRSDQYVRKPIVLPNGTTLFSIKSEELDDSAGLPCTEDIDQSILTHQAQQNQQLQTQLQHLQSMQHEIVTHQTQLMNTLNVVNKNISVNQQQTPGIQHVRQLSEDQKFSDQKVSAHKMGFDNLKYCITR
jgi:hypothetical protein